MMSELTDLGIADLRDGFRAGDFTAREVADTGSFTGLGSAASFDELNQLFTRDH